MDKPLLVTVITLVEDEHGITAVEVAPCPNPLCPERAHQQLTSGYPGVAALFQRYAAGFLLQMEEEGSA